MKDTTQTRAPITTADGFVEKRKVGAEQLGHKLPSFGERTRFFLLAAHPSSWDLVETTKGWYLVPTLKRLIVQAGVNFTRAVKEGQTLDASDIEAKFRTRFGDTVLTEVDEYMYSADGAKGTKGHFLTWENVKAYPDGAFEIQFDQDGYDLWRWSLVADKRIAPPRDSVISQLRTRLSRTKNRATRTPHLAQAQEAQKAAETRISGMDAAVKALGELSKPKAASADKKGAA